jgi:hypothetical protein
MLKEIPLLRAPENKRTGIEIKPNVRYPDQTEAAMSSPRKNQKGARAAPSDESLAHSSFFDASTWRGNREKKHDPMGPAALRPHGW